MVASTETGLAMELKKMTGENITVKPGESFEQAALRTIKEKNGYIKDLHAKAAGRRGMIAILWIVLGVLLYALMGR